MKLLTKAILAQFRKVGDQSNEKDPLIICKFFDPTSQRTWYPCEYDEEYGIFYGFVVGIESEWGTFGLDELERRRGCFGLGVERDLYFSPTRFSELRLS